MYRDRQQQRFATTMMRFQMKSRPSVRHLALIASTLALAACGGSGGGPDPIPGPPADPTDQQRAGAATTTATTNPNCAEGVLGPFYWEVGDAGGAKVSGRVGSGIDATTQMPVASASKWVYAAYVLQRRGGVASGDVPFLNFTSGYTEFRDTRCSVLDTVGSCLGDKTGRQLITIDKYSYGSGHMQNHAVAQMGLGPLNASALASEVGRIIGDFGFTYGNVNLAGGMHATPSGYGGFLRALLLGNLQMKGALGTHKVCADPTTCTSTAVNSPMDSAGTGETWNYSLGHWVEDDSKVGDHAFSSAGALGFYPWIDATKTYYGILARRATEADSQGYVSARCGRLIRQAWVTGKAVTATTPSP
jgi:hypothetical protein